MDPEAAYSNAVQALARHRANQADEDNRRGDEIELEALRDLADAFEALNEWLTKGGAVPSAWVVGRTQ